MEKSRVHLGSELLTTLVLFKNQYKQLFRAEIGVYLLIWMLYMLAPVYTPSKDPVSLDIGYYFLSLNQFIVVSVILFWLIPKYLNKSKYGYLSASIIIVVIVGSLLEELILEPVFYSTGKGQKTNLYDIWHSITQLVPVVILFSAFKLIWDFKERKRQIDKLEKEKSLTELHFLKAQLNPHVLFNTLTSIYADAMKDTPKIAEMILKLSNLMRYMLKQSDNLVPLKNEIDEMVNFIDLQKLRVPKKSDISFEISGNVNSCYIPPMILISIVENCFKHSLNSNLFFVHINLTIENQLLFFETENSIGSSPAINSIGIGMDNIQRRLNLQYPDRHKLETFPFTNKYRLKLQIELGHEEN